MKKHKTYFQGSVFLFAVVIAFGILYLSGNSWSSGTSSPTKAQSKLDQGAGPPVRVENKVESVEVISAELKDESVQLLFRNSSNKVIKAFVLLKSGGQKSFVQLSDKNNIVPGGIHTETFRLPQGEKLQTASILAVLYEDNKGEGEPQVVQELTDMRLGEQIQNERIYSYVKKLSTVSNSKLMSEVISVKEAIKSLPDDKNISDYVKIGLHNARESAILDLEQLEADLKESNEAKVKFRIQNLESIYEKRASKNKP
jgi:hypothetical protein